MYQQQQQFPSISPGKPLDSLIEDFRSMDPHHHQHHHHHSDQISPLSLNKANPNPYQRGGSTGIIRPNTSHEMAGEHSSPGYNHPSSPRYNATELNEFNGPLPISPHVNVPNAHNFNHNPPPLPPRKRHPKKHPHDYINSQLRQAADAPTLLPRDMDPPPLPPRLPPSSVSSMSHGNSNSLNAWSHSVNFFSINTKKFLFI